MKRLLIILLSIILLTSCAGTKQRNLVNSASSKPIQLSQSAQKIYTFLKFWQLSKQGLFQEAEKEAQKLLNLDPEPYTYLEVANFYWQHTKFEQARTILKQAIKKWPKTKELYLSLAKSYLAENRFQAAQITLEEYLKTCPKDYSVYSELAAIYLKTKKYAEIIDLLKKIPASKQSKIALYYLARANFELGLTLSAEKYLKKALAKDPNFFEAWAELAYIYESTKRYAEAEEVYSKLLQSDPKNEKLVLKLIKLNLKLNNPQKAMSIFKKYTLSLNNQLDVVSYFMDNEYYEYARTILNNIIKQNGYSDIIYFYLALLNYSTNNLDKAIYWLSQVHPNSTNYKQFLKFKVQILLTQNKLKKAEIILSKLLQKYPKDKEILKLKIDLLTQEKKYKEALKELVNILKMWPDDKFFLYKKAIILETLKQHQKAMQLMEKIITLYPDYAPALNFVGYSLAEKGKDLARAKVLIEQALKLEPENGYYLDSLAWVYFKLKKYSKAWEYINRAVQNTKDDPVIWEHYGDIALKLNLIERAKKGYKKSLKLNPQNLKVKTKLNSILHP
ncbi:MAG: tetratricopeptide repeat protein [Desulfonauticus sp.]|nr:tetratricopeptide repeat protein [Desulfonauticus sp.]